MVLCTYVYVFDTSISLYVFSLLLVTQRTLFFEHFFFFYLFILIALFDLFVPLYLQLLYYRYEATIEFQFVLLLTMPLIMVCASLRKLRFIAPLSTFANFALISGVTTILYYSCSNLYIDDSIRYTYKKWTELPMMFGIIMFSFEGIGLVNYGFFFFKFFFLCKDYSYGVYFVTWLKWR